MGKGRLLACVLALSALPSLAAAKKPLRVVPSVFDPNHTHAVGSDWLPFFGRHEADEALLMFKLTATSVDVASGATVENVDGRVLDELGFDVFNGGHCGAGAPRFDVTTVDGSIYFFGCAYGTHTPAPDRPITFMRVRFADADAVPQTATTPPWPGFGHARVAHIDIVFDEGPDVGSGFTALDNIDINGELIGSGGHHHGGDDDDRDRD
jgi:hypothetical protein